MENESSSSDSSDDIINKVFFKKYHCIKKLGEGSFGRIYEGVYNSEHFALKFEDINSNSNLLESEASIMNYLKGPNIPNVRSYGTSGNYNILIMQLMGKSLEDLIYASYSPYSKSKVADGKIDKERNDLMKNLK